LNTSIVKVKRIGSPSINGEAYIVKAAYRGQELVMAMKKMPGLAKNNRELKLYDYFTKVVLDGVNPHFPIIYKSTECNGCVYDNPDIGRKSKECLVCFNELANGDLESFITFSPDITDSALVSMWCQMAIAGFALEKKKYAHNDLHWGNILYHNVPEYEGAYMHYKIDNDNVYIRSSGHHWVMWDLGEVSTSTKNASLRTDMRRLSGIRYWTPRLTHEQMLLCDAIERYAIFNTGYKELLYSLNKLQIASDVLYINPAMIPGVVINKVPYKVR
jgi:hypothetical protein